MEEFTSRLMEDSNQRSITKMMDANNIDVVCITDLPETGISGAKRKREAKLRSKVWDHFTKKEGEGQAVCNHCNKTYSSSSRSGTTHLLRHITSGICPEYKGDTPQPLSKLPARDSSNQATPASTAATFVVPWKFNEEAATTTQQDEPLPESGESQTHEWMEELSCSVYKLVDVVNRMMKPGENQGKARAHPDYSISAAIKCLNEMKDIPETGEMYVDVFEILEEADMREAFICLSPEPRRRWLQRILKRRYPSRYGS